MNQKTKDIFSSLFGLFFSIYIAIESYRFDLGRWSIPGPGYFPFVAGLLFGIISILFLFKTLRKPSSEVKIGFDSKVRWTNIALTLGGMVIYVFLLGKVGFFLCTLLLGVFFLRLVTQQRWSTTLIVTLSVTLGTYLLFNILLDAQLPKSILGF